jgi:tRNA(Met) cytidine acetyltransferase
MEEYAQRIVDNLKEHLPPRITALVRKLGRSIANALASNHRRMVVISGSDPVQVAAAVARIILYYERVYRKRRPAEELSGLYVFHDEFVDAKLRKEIVKRAVRSRASITDLTIARYEESERYLGTTFNFLVLDLVNDLKPNDVGRLVGVVGGGGLVILTVPRWGEWDSALTLFKQNLLVPGYDQPRHVFISWFKRKLLEHKGIYVYNADTGEILNGVEPSAKAHGERKIKIPDNTAFPRELYELALTQDQVNVLRELEALIEPPKKRRKRVLLITSDRGRGKSGAVGIGSIGLALALREKKPSTRIVVTAPSLDNVQSFFTLALEAAEKLKLHVDVVKRRGSVLEIHGRGFRIEYWEPMHVPRLKADIVIVDEAAGIHVPLLHKIWRKHRRIVFSTTIHGYEGAGRGFSVRFLPVLQRDPDTVLTTIEMHEPIRYARDDPIERWLFDALLLDAEPAELDERDLKDIEEGRLTYLKLNPEELFSRSGEGKLRELFGIYVLAHYRNEPDDLGMIADAPHHVVRAVATSSGKIVCALQIANEGGLDGDIVEDLLRGGRIAGNIIPDRVLKHVRIRDFGHMRGWRIVRIATHPQVQGRGIGSYALSKVVEEATQIGLDWVGSGFGVNEQLLNFWLKNGFLPVHMSPDRNPVSGEYTMLVLRPITPEAEKIVTIANREFKRKLLESLPDPYNDLEVEVAAQILKNGAPIDESHYPHLTDVQLDRLWIYAYGPMTYEAAADAIRELARFYWTVYPRTRGLTLSKREEYILISKVLQGNSWAHVAEQLGIKQHTVMVVLKDIVRKMLNHYYGINETSPVGVPLARTSVALPEAIVPPLYLRRSEDDS